MSHRKNAAVASVLVILTLTVAACRSGGDSQRTSAASPSPSAPTTPVRATLTAPELQPPSQVNKYTRTSGRPKVVFDPCTWIPDDALAKIGFDPATRFRSADIVAEYTFLTCQVETDDKTLTLQLASGNITMDEDKQQYAGQTQPATVNGRDALVTTHKASGPVCDLDMQTKVGFFEIGLIVDTNGLVKGLKTCDRIDSIAAALEPFIGKDN